MSVTAKLVRVFDVDKQLSGLKSRLGGAERFLAEQVRLLDELNARAKVLDGQIRVLQVQAAEHEGEMAGHDSRIAKLRDQMANSKTNKEYKAFQTELSTLKIERDKEETEALEIMTRLEALRKERAELDAAIVERERVKKVAECEREQRAGEIAGRLAQLTAERATLAADLPSDVLRDYERLLNQRGEDAMAQLEEINRKALEYSCGSCRMAVPVEKVSSLLNRGVVTRCVSCGCFVYLDEETMRSILLPKTPNSKGRKGKTAEQL